VSFVWIAWHVWVALRAFGFPKQLRTMRDVYHWDAIAVLFVTVPIFSVLFVTVPIFSVPAWGANPTLMLIAWAIFAPHLALNVWYLLHRSSVAWLRRTSVKTTGTLIYLAITAYAAYHSFLTMTH
jgi:hypothetical protein